MSISLWFPRGDKWDELGICRQYAGEMEEVNNVMLDDIKGSEIRIYDLFYNLDLSEQENGTLETTCGGFPAKMTRFDVRERPVFNKSPVPNRGNINAERHPKSPLVKFFCAVGKKRYVITYHGDFSLVKKEVKTMINSFKAVNFLSYKKAEVGISSILYPSDWQKKENLHYSNEDDRFAEVVTFSYYNPEDQEAKSRRGFLTICIRNYDNIPFDRYVNRYIMRLRIKNFLSSFYLVTESETSRVISIETKQEILDSSQKEIEYRVESLIHEEIQITERIAVSNGKAYHITAV